MAAKLARAAAAALALAAAHAAQANEYPNKPIKMVVTVAAGGPIDTIARLVADQMAGPLGQSIVVENRAGAGGTLGARS
ncbi:MAG TPA: tripartite tricarboxylate transporter substrate-binding protein, partial [Beijerinckiaceae bacterium]